MDGLRKKGFALLTTLTNAAAKDPAAATSAVECLKALVSQEQHDNRIAEMEENLQKAMALAIEAAEAASAGQTAYGILVKQGSLQPLTGPHARNVG